jgi:3-methyladenine DNA glycosylase AlkC
MSSSKRTAVAQTPKKKDTKNDTKNEPRKGARNIASIAPDVLLGLEAGTMSSANLTEGLAINMHRLMKVVAPKVPTAAIDSAAGIVQRMSQAGAALRSVPKLTKALADHPSDTVRGWVAFAIGQDESVQPMKRLEAMQLFAADTHFGVREWAWMAVRAIVVEEPRNALGLLLPWTANADANIRRFASEATRPRGVWAASIPLLRKEPQHARPLLDALKHDVDRYVEDSVANWLNDAAKDQPAWVRDLLMVWKNDGVSDRLLTRAARSLK